MYKSLSELKEKQKADFKKIKNKSNAILRTINLNHAFPLMKQDIYLSLSGKTFAIKDNFAIKNEITTNGTKLLENFKPNFNSTVYKKLVGEGALPLYKTNMDELAMGGTGLTSGFGPVYNPFDPEYIVGGSSSGSAYVVAKGYVDFAIGSDTGDSVRKPAAYANIVGFKPTWGLVSRYGVFDFAPSWDTVGWFSKDVDQAAKLLDVLQGYDPKDSSSILPRENNFFNDIDKLDKENLTLGIISDFVNEIVEPKIIEEFNLFIDKLKADGYKIVNLKLDHDLFQNLLAVYRIASSIEGYSTNSNLTGFLFGNKFNSIGNFDQDITNARSNFTYEVKKRFIFANLAFLNDNQIYVKAKKIRRLLIEYLDTIFEEVDAIVIPTNASFASHKEKYLDINKYDLILDNFLTAYNANGSPSITIPIYKEGYKTLGINISTKIFTDKKCLQIAKQLEVYKNGEK